MHIENCERERERERESSLGGVDQGRWSSTQGAWVVRRTIYELRRLSISRHGECRALSKSLRVWVRGRSGGWGKRLNSELGVGRRDGAVLGAVRRVPYASVDRRSLLVWTDGGDRVVQFSSASTFVREPLLSLLLLIWKVKGNCCSTSNCTGDVMLSCQQGVDFKSLLVSL